jgi:hypothetical protein
MLTQIIKQQQQKNIFVRSLHRYRFGCHPFQWAAVRLFSRNAKRICQHQKTSDSSLMRQQNQNAILWFALRLGARNVTCLRITNEVRQPTCAVVNVVIPKSETLGVLSAVSKMLRAARSRCMIFSLCRCAMPRATPRNIRNKSSPSSGALNVASCSSPMTSQFAFRQSIIESSWW